MQFFKSAVSFLYQGFNNREETDMRKEKNRFMYCIAKKNIYIGNELVKLIFIGDLIKGKRMKDEIYVNCLISLDRYENIDIKMPIKNIYIISEQLFESLSAIKSPERRLRALNVYKTNIKEFNVNRSVQINVSMAKKWNIFGFIRNIVDLFEGKYYGIEVTNVCKCNYEKLEKDDDLIVETSIKKFPTDFQFKIDDNRNVRIYAPIDKISLSDSVLNKYCQICDRKKTLREDPFENILEPVNNMRVGDEIEITVDKSVMRFVDGKIHWFGKNKNDQTIMVGVEVEGFYGNTDGEYNGFRYFKLPMKTGKFVSINDCHPKNYHIDILVSKAEEASKQESNRYIEEDFSETIDEYIKPISIHDLISKIKFTGLKKGIQGNINSCYIDSVLFSMFASTSLFDQILLANDYDFESNTVKQIRKIIRSEIVYPLRKNGFVAASKVTQLRCALSDLFNNSSFLNEEKDPEEFINILLGNVFNYDVKLKLNSNQEMYCFQLFADKNEAWDFPSVQQLFEQSLITNKLKIAEIPQYIVLQMPRYGIEYKMYNYIFPSPTLNLSELIVNHPRGCCVCGMLARFECVECYSSFPNGISFCKECYEQSHKDKHNNHKSTKLEYNSIYNVNENNAELDLLAVICIETSHYISFTKMNPKKNIWAFFDSMSKREEGINGRNTPCVTLEDIFNYKNGKLEKPDKKNMLGNLMTKRLIRDVYYCIYQNTKILE